MRLSRELQHTLNNCSCGAPSHTLAVVNEETFPFVACVRCGRMGDAWSEIDNAVVAWNQLYAIPQVQFDWISAQSASVETFEYMQKRVLQIVSGVPSFDGTASEKVIGIRPYLLNPYQCEVNTLKLGRHPNPVKTFSLPTQWLACPEPVSAFQFHTWQAMVKKYNLPAELSNTITCLLQPGTQLEVSHDN